MYSSTVTFSQDLNWITKITCCLIYIELPDGKCVSRFRKISSENVIFLFPGYELADHPFITVSRPR